MGKKNQTAAAETMAPNADFDTFDGVTAVKELDGMWEKSPGAVIIGKLSHVFNYKPKRPDASGQRREVACLALVTTKPCVASQNGESYEFPADSLIGVTVGKKLEGLLVYQPGTKFAIKAVRETDLGGGQRVWEYEVKANGRKNARGGETRPTAVVDESAETPEGDPL